MNARSLAPLALLLALGCDGSEPAEDAAEAPAAAPDRASAAAAPSDARGPDAVPEAVEELVPPAAAAPWRADALDTGIDLSHLRAQSRGTAFPEAPQPAAPTAQAVEAAPPVPAGPPGDLALAEGAEDTADFGEVLEGETPSHVFRLQSAGENPLVIERVKPSCGCTAAEIVLVDGDERRPYVMGQPIEAGTELELETSLSTARRQGDFRSNVAIYSNDPDSPMRLQLVADVTPVLEVEPRLVDFGRITSADTAEGTITVRSEVLDPFLLTLDESTLLEPLTAELVPLEPNAEGKSTRWEVRVALGPDIPEGIRRYALRLETDVPAPGADDHAGHDHGEDEAEAAHADEHHQVHVNVQAQVSGLVVATPSFLSLGLVRPGERVERTVRIETLDEGFTLPSDPATRIVGRAGQPFELADHFSVTVEPVEEGRSLDLTLALEGLPDDFAGSFNGVVQVDVGHPTKETVEVTFSGVSRPGLPPPAAGPPAGG